LPEKVNKLIVSEQVTTLPLIRAGSKVFYNMKETTQTNTNDLNNINQNNNNIQEQSQQIYSKEQIITKQTQSSHNQFESQSDLEKIFLAQQQQNTQITTENEQNGGEFDIDEYLKQQGYNTNVQVQNNETEENIDYLAAFKTQQNSQAQQIDLQGYNLENLGNMNTTTTTTTTVQNTQNINDINTDANQLETKKLMNISRG